MKKALFVLAVWIVGTTSLFAQHSEFSVIFGGSARSVDDGDGPADPNAADLDDSFSLSNSSFEFAYGVELEPGTMFRIKAGRIETPVRVALGSISDPEAQFYYDTEGEVQHIDAVIDYRFSEPLGTAGIFGGVAMYRQIGERSGPIPENTDLSEVDYGFLFGFNADFPLSRRYGVILEATHHWTNLTLDPKFLTVSGGLRIRF
jgi:hypothetical protein